MQTFLFLIAIISLFLILYSYIGYPLLLWVIHKCLPEKKILKGRARPNVTLIISCYNEENVLAEKLENSLELDYPKEQFEILVVSDGSTDRTDEIAKAYSERGVRLIRQEGRLGKTMGLNLAVPQATGEIIVFSDANAMYQSDAVLRMVENFADQSVGYVVGEARYIDSGQVAASSSENSYWNYEIFLKKMESNLHSVVGGDGAIYAIRKELYEELKQTDINDFVNPLQIVAKGYRGVYETAAIAFEGAAGSFSKEFKRKGRIVNRAFSGLFRVKEVMNPFKTGLFAFEIISHKLIRWLIPFFLIILVISSAGLAWMGEPFGQLVIVLISAGCFMACLGWYGQKKRFAIHAVFFLPYYFTIVNLAAFFGVVQSLKGDVQVTWETVRQDTHKNTVHNQAALLFLAGVILFLTLLFLMIVLSSGIFNAAAFLFWFSVSVICYVYLGYPMVLFIWSRTRPIAHSQDETFQPDVTILICAYNEEAVIRDKIENSLALDYPPEKLQIVIASDGSTDKTAKILEEYQHHSRLHFCDYEKRRGKIGALLETIPQISSDVVVFSDANTMYSPNALKMLVRNFADPSVGAVSGDVILQNSETSYSVSESAYYVYERWIQQKESRIGSIIGADGAMYAIRRHLFIPPSSKTILDDFVISMNVALQGLRVIYEPEAVGYELNLISHRGEFIRKSRIVAGAVQSLISGEGVPAHNQPKLLFCYFSHKLLRWAVPCLLLMCLATNIILFTSQAGNGLGVFLAIQCIFYTLAFFGYINRSAALGRVLSVPFYFCLVNGAALFGIYKGLFNKQKVAWEIFSRKRSDTSRG